MMSYQERFILELVCDDLVDNLLLISRVFPTLNGARTINMTILFIVICTLGSCGGFSPPGSIIKKICITPLAIQCF